MISARQIGARTLIARNRVRVWGLVKVMVRYIEVRVGTSSAFRGWVRVLGYGF